MSEDRRAGACGLACCRVRKRWDLDDPAGAFVEHADVFVDHVNVTNSLAVRDTDAVTGPAARFGCAVTDGSACIVLGCVVLPAH